MYRQNKKADAYVEFSWRRKLKRTYGQPLTNTKFHRHHHTFISFGAEKRSIIIDLKTTKSYFVKLIIVLWTNFRKQKILTRRAAKPRQSLKSCFRQRVPGINFNKPIQSALTVPSLKRPPQLRKPGGRTEIPASVCLQKRSYHRYPPVNRRFYNSYKPYGLTTLVSVVRCLTIPFNPILMGGGEC